MLPSLLEGGDDVIERDSHEGLCRYLFLNFDGPERVRVEASFEILKEARSAFSIRGDWDFDPNPPPLLALDLDDAFLTIFALSYNASEGMCLAEEFALLGDLDEGEAGSEENEHWSDAYVSAPRVSPSLSPTERTRELYNWFESDWRDDWSEVWMSMRLGQAP